MQPNRGLSLVKVINVERDYRNNEQSKFFSSFCTCAVIGARSKLAGMTSSKAFLRCSVINM